MVKFLSEFIIIDLAFEQYVAELSLRSISFDRVLRAAIPMLVVSLAPRFQSSSTPPAPATFHDWLRESRLLPWGYCVEIMWSFNPFKLGYH